MPFIEQQLSADGVTTEGRHIVSEALHEIITNDHISSMTVAIGSPQASGYAIGDTFRLNSGTPVIVNGDSFHATGRVTAVDSPDTGNPTGVEIISWGAYTALPSMSPISSPEGTVLQQPTVTLTGAGDDNLVVDITTDTAKWTSDRYTVDSPTTSVEWLASSVKVSNAPTIGYRSEQSGADDGGRLEIGSSYSGILPWGDQPGSPPTSTFYIAVPNQDPKIYVSTTERRVNMLVTDGSSKQYCGMGLFIPFTDVDSNYPFPAIIHAQATTVRTFNEVYSTSNRGIVHPIDFSGLGCYQYRNNLSTEWFGITLDNNDGADTCKAQIWPARYDMDTWEINHAPVSTNSVNVIASDMDPESWQGECFYFDDSLYFAADQDSTVGPCGPAPLGTGGQLHFTIQTHIISNLVNDAQMIGVVDGWETVHGRGLQNFDEIQNQDGRRYIVFADTSSANLVHWTAMEMI
jgi:hypothetical protein